MPYRVLLLIWLLVFAIVPRAYANKADDTLRVLWGTDAPLQSLDFYFSSQVTAQDIASLVWDTLVWRDPADFSYKPLLAKRWIRADDTTLEFELRDDVVFQDGSRLTAADVVGTVNAVANPAFRVAVPRNVNWIAAAVQTGIYRVQIISKEPFPAALDYIATMLPIYPAEHYSAAGPEGMGAHPVGSGPYRIVSLAAGKDYRLTRNEYYFKGGPKGDRFIKTIDVREVPDEQTRVAELLAHHADIIWGVSNSQLQQIAHHPGYQVAQTETMDIAYLGLDAARRSETPALQSNEVRQAIAYAVDRQSIVEKLVNAPARVVDAPCHPRMFGCASEAARHYDYAPDKARELLHSSGYEGKVAFDLLVDPSLKAAGEAVASNLGKVGITARLRVLDRPALHAEMNGGRAPMVLSRTNANPLDDVSETIGLAFLPGKQDFAHDPDLHEWLEDAQQSFDPDKRRALYAKSIERITDQVYWLPLFTFGLNYAFTDEVAFTPSVDGLARLYRVQWK